MKKQLAFLPSAFILVAFPVLANARPHHGHHALAARPAASPVALRLQPIAFDPTQNGGSARFEFAPDQIARDRIPMSASDHFGRGGVASVGYEPGVARSLVGAHELNAAFSSQSMAFGGMVGGGVSLHF
jgi:hypothetical protein